MDTLDVFGVGAKVGCMVDFVFEELCGLVIEVRSWAWKRGMNVRCR